MRTLANISYAIASLVITLHAWLATQLGAFEDMYRDVGGTIPLVTRIALSAAWRYGVPIAMAGLVVLAIVKRRTHPRMPIAVALIAIVVLAGTSAAAQWPAFELAGSIR